VEEIIAEAKAEVDYQKPEPGEIVPGQKRAYTILQPESSSQTGRKTKKGRVTSKTPFQDKQLNNTAASSSRTYDAIFSNNSSSSSNPQPIAQEGIGQEGNSPAEKPNDDMYKANDLQDFLNFVRKSHDDVARPVNLSYAADQSYTSAHIFGNKRVLEEGEIADPADELVEDTELTSVDQAQQVAPVPVITFDAYHRSSSRRSADLLTAATRERSVGNVIKTSLQFLQDDRELELLGVSTKSSTIRSSGRVIFYVNQSKKVIKFEYHFEYH
jgi:hypothetical protein